MAIRRILLCIGLVFATFSARTLALGIEDFGGDSLNEANYTEFPGIVPVITQSPWIYHSWCNGNESFYYQTDAAALNAVLEKFSAAKANKHELVLRPGPTVIEEFDGKKSFPYTWNIHLIGGVCGDLPEKDKGDLVWSKSPTITAYISDQLHLKDLKIPPGVSVVTLAELKTRYRSALSSTDEEVRGWGAGELAMLDPLDSDSVAAVSKLLADKDDWVRLNAVGALAEFGHTAASALPTLRELEHSPSKTLAEEARNAVDQIEKGEDRSTQQRQQQALMDQIKAFAQSKSAK